LEIFSTAANQVLVLFAFILVGYILTKTEILKVDASKDLSNVLVYVATPSILFNSCAKNINTDNIATSGMLLFAGVIVVFAGYFTATALAKPFSKNDFEKNVYTYSFTIPNLGYMGYPMVQAVFGDQALAAMVMFVFAMNVFIYIKGLPMLSSRESEGIKFVLKQPTIIALFAGIAVGLTGIKLPRILDDVTSGASALMGPIAMILTGSVLSKRPIKELISDKKTYIASVIRLVLLPLITLGIMILLKVDKNIILVAVATLAMPLGLNSVVFPEAYGGDGRLGARLALVSHAMSILTIPAVFGLLSIILL